MSYSNPRIQMTMSFTDIIAAMAEGNLGAVTVLMQLLKESPIIDPDDALAPLGPLFGLDNLDCYGSRIWILYKNVCGSNISRTVGALRAVQLGHITSRQLNSAIDGNPIDLDDALSKVRATLPAFMISPDPDTAARISVEGEKEEP